MLRNHIYFASVAYLVILYGSSANGEMLTGLDRWPPYLERARVLCKGEDCAAAKGELSVHVSSGILHGFGRLIDSSSSFQRELMNGRKGEELKESGLRVIYAHLNCVASMWAIRLLVEKIEEENGKDVPSYVTMIGQVVKKETALAEKKGMPIILFERNDRKEMDHVISSLHPGEVSIDNLRIARLLMEAIVNGILSKEIPLGD